MLLLGLTGSIGMGKSTAATHFRMRGIPVVDADRIVHELYEGDAVPLVAAAFPGTTIGGKVDRNKLAQALLNDTAGMQRLERIVHPLVQTAERRQLIAAYSAGAQLAVLEIPLLFETGGDERVDATIVVSAPAEVQRARVLLRPGMTASKFDALVARQMPDAEKRCRADFVVETGGTLEASGLQIDAIIAAVSSRVGQAYSKFWA